MRGCSGAGLALFIVALVSLAGCVSGGQDSDNRSVIARGLDSLAGLGANGSSAGGTNAHMDGQQQELQKRLAGRNIAIIRAGDQLVLTIPSVHLFDASKDALKSGSVEELDAIAAVLKKNTRTVVDVYGHTDADGDERKNLDLTQKRALAVAQYLSKQGVDARRLSVTGFGSSRPVGPNDTAEGRTLNRRIEIQLSPPGKRST